MLLVSLKILHSYSQSCRQRTANRTRCHRLNATQNRPEQTNQSESESKSTSNQTLEPGVAEHRLPTAHCGIWPTATHASLFTIRLILIDFNPNQFRNTKGHATDDKATPKIRIILPSFVPGDAAARAVDALIRRALVVLRAWAYVSGRTTPTATHAGFDLRSQESRPPIMRQLKNKRLEITRPSRRSHRRRRAVWADSRSSRRRRSRSSTSPSNSPHLT